MKLGALTLSAPRHTGLAEVDTEVWDFDPNDDLKKTKDVVSRGFEAQKK
jgi:hypothetical protein